MRRIGKHLNFRGGEFYLALVFLLFLVMVGVYWFFQENGSLFQGESEKRGAEVVVDLPEAESESGGVSAAMSLSGVLVSFDPDVIRLESDGVETTHSVAEDVLISRIDRGGQFVEEGQASIDTVRLSREDLEVGTEVTLIFNDTGENVKQIMVFE